VENDRTGRSRARLGATRLRKLVRAVGPRPRRRELRGRYLDLLERAITHNLYHPPDTGEPTGFRREEFRRELERTGGVEGLSLGSPQMARLKGRDLPIYAPTMVGRDRLRNVRRIVEQVVADRVPGDLIEAGCWRGGVGILMRGVLEAYGSRDRSVWLADSFQGVPAPNEERYPADAGDLNHTADELAVSLGEVQSNFRRFGLLDERVRFLEGWFRDTLPGVRDRRWAVVRLDGDLYESTMDGLVNLYPGLAVRGYLIVDDFGFPNCRAAVDDYRREHGITEPIERIDWTGVYWRRRE
jgi:O-methyltransferase